MTDFEKELIYYIFHVQDADDDNLSAEVICRKLYKYGLIDRGRGYWRPKKRPRYRWPARIIRKAEQTEPQKKCKTCEHRYAGHIEVCDACDPYAKDEPQSDCGKCEHSRITCRYMERGEPCHYEPKDEPTISKMEQVDKDINVLSKDEPQTEDADCDKCIWSVCNYNKAFAFEDEPQTDTEIAKAIVHKMIDDAVIAEDAYPDLRQKMHDAVDEYEPQTDCAWK